MAKKTKPTDDIKEEIWYRSNGQPFMTVVTFPVRRKSFQTERVLRVLSELYPDGTDEISTAVIHRRVVAKLKPESKRVGLRDPSLPTVARVLGRR